MMGAAQNPRALQLARQGGRSEAGRSPAMGGTNGSFSDLSRVAVRELGLSNHKRGIYRTIAFLNDGSLIEVP